MAVSITIGITQNSQSITNNTSNVTVKVTASWTGGSNNRLGECHGYIKIDGTQYDFTGLTFNDNQTTSGSKVVMTKTVNVSHASDGTKKLDCSASFSTYVSSGTVKATASKTLTTIPRKSSLSVANGTLKTAQTLTVTKQATAFTHTITYKCGTASGTICSKSSDTSISWTPPISLASQNTTDTSVSITYTITTYNGSTNVGSNTYTKTCTIPDIAETRPSCTVTAEESTTYSKTCGGMVKGYSKVVVKVTPTLAYNSPIDSYKTTANGTSYTSASFTTGALKSSGTLTIKATVTDKRGRSGTGETTIQVLDYAPPTITDLSVHRCDEDGTLNDEGEYIEVSYAYDVSSLNGNNESDCVLQYKIASESSYTTPDDFTPSASGKYIFAADTGSSYDILLSVSDKLATSTKTTSASTAFVIMHWKSSGYGMAIGKISEDDNVFDVGMQTRHTGGILHPLLEPDTDLNDVRTPNTYVGANVTTYNYGNCPITSGTFSLEVIGMGEEGQVMQKLTICHKTQSSTCARYYYQDSWGEWEWQNPPMQVGVEYRTTELYMGKPVYTKLVNFGALPATTNKNVAHASAVNQVIIYLQGQMSDGVPFSTGYNHNRTANKKFWVDATKWNIRILTEADMSTFTAHVHVKYVKE